MEDRYAHPANGDEFRAQDANSISDNAALADDRILWELFRPVAGSATPDKLIVPYASRTWGAIGAATSNALVWGNTADALVHVMPFRAIVGSTTVIGTSPIEHMRGQRSGYMVGTSTLYRTTAIAANVSGNPRWTLVYAAVTPAASGDTVSIIGKDPITKLVAPHDRAINTRCTVTIATTDGTPAATPTRPNLPSDGAGTYYIALAYIYVPDGFGGSSPVDKKSIYEVAPCARISPQVGAVSCVPADQQHEAGGTVDDRQGPGTDTRPGAYIPSTMVGAEHLCILFQFGYGSPSHMTGDYVDRSRDWRFRYFKWTASGRAGTDPGDALASDHAFSGASPVPYRSDPVEVGMGQSFSASTGAAASTYGPVMYLSGSDSAKILGAALATVAIYCDDSDGSLKVTTTGSPGSQIVVWLEATGPYSNFGTI